MIGFCNEELYANYIPAFIVVSLGFRVTPNDRSLVSLPIATLYMTNIIYTVLSLIEAHLQ